MVGPVDSIASAQRLLLQQGPRRGYYPEPAKSILITLINTTPSDLEALEEFQFQQSQGHLGGFVGSGPTEEAWIDPQIERWVDGVKALARVAHRFPQTAYAGLCHSLQAEWQYLQRVTPQIDQAFAPLESAIAQIFLPALLDSTIEEVGRHLRPLLALPAVVRLGGIGIPDPTTTGTANFQTSTATTSLLQASLLHGTPPSAPMNTAAKQPQDATLPKPTYMLPL